MPTMLLTTVPGLEQVAAAEIAEILGRDVVGSEPGRIRLQVGESELPGVVRRLNRRACCIGRVGLELARATVGDLAGIADVVAATDVSGMFTPGATFVVRARRLGEHDFRSPDIERAAGAAVVAAVTRSRGGCPRVRLRGADVLIRVDLQGTDLSVWLDTTGEVALHARAYRLYSHMASMRPTVANLLLRLAGWEGEALVDPFCGSATLPIEAILRARGVAPAEHRGVGWAWERLGPLARPNGGDAGVTPRPAASEGPLRVLGVERFPRHLQGAMRNAAAAGVGAHLLLRLGRAQHLARALQRAWGRDGTRSRPIVVTNPPFGRRVGSMREALVLYRDAARSWRDAGVRRVVTLAENGAGMAEALESAGYPPQVRLAVAYGGVSVTVFRADAG